VVEASPTIRRYVVHDVNGCQRYSLASLIHNIRALMSASTTASDISQSTVNAACEKIAELAITADVSDLFIPDASTLKMPQTLIVEALIGPYFDSVACYMPIWTSSSFRKLLLSFKNNEQILDNRAFTVCCNNLVLLSLTSRTLNSRARNPSNSFNDLELIQSFVINASRAISNVEQLCRPRLINVQALLSLVGRPLSN
jgi:hypothetical protein